MTPRWRGAVARRRSVRVIGVAAAIWVGGPALANAQCRPPANSNVARLMAFYEVPIIFATADAPVVLPPGKVDLTGELVGVPSPSGSITMSDYCYMAKQEGSHLAPVLPRLRVGVGLPAGFAVEGSYVPPITVDRATPNFGSLAVSWDKQLSHPTAEHSGPIVTLQVRAHGTAGSVKGSITCPSGSLQQTDPGQPCYGTMPSHDTYYPNSVGGEVAVGVASSNGAIAGFAGTGYTWLSPNFRVGFTNLNDVTDNTLVEVGLGRVPVFGGVSVRIIKSLDAAASVYSNPVDATTWRLVLRYRIG
jgi:hypothetical protein